MKIAIVTMGTLGDVRPYVALASGLRRAGYDVTLATGRGFAALVEGAGVSYAPLEADVLELMQAPESRAALRSPRAALRVLRQVGPTLRRVLEGEWAAARGADAVVYHPKALGGASIAERLGVPAFLALPVPAYSPTRAFPNPLLLSRDLGPLNRATYGPLNRLLALSTRGVVNGWRGRTLGLPRLGPLADELGRG